jgi:hypothetical protein
MTSSLKVDPESLRERQARAQEADRISHDTFRAAYVARSFVTAKQLLEQADGDQMARAILTRRRLKCIAEGAHPEPQSEATEQARCPRCGT